MRRLKWGGILRDISTVGKVLLIVVLVVTSYWLEQHWSHELKERAALHEEFRERSSRTEEPRLRLPSYVSYPGVVIDKKFVHRSISKSRYIVFFRYNNSLLEVRNSNLYLVVDIGDIVEVRIRERFLLKPVIIIIVDGVEYHSLDSFIL